MSDTHLQPQDTFQDFLREFLKEVDVKDIKKTLNHFLSFYFVENEKFGAWLPKHQEEVVLHFTQLSQLLDKLQNLQCEKS